MSTVKEVLNELKWKKEFNLDKAEIWYIHRGAPADTRIISGSEVINLGKSFIETATAMIPYHRILRVTYEGEIVFER